MTNIQTGSVYRLTNHICHFFVTFFASPCWFTELIFHFGMASTSLFALDYTTIICLYFLVKCTCTVSLFTRVSQYVFD